MSTIIDSIEKSQLRKGIPRFSAGDRVRVHFQVTEGTRTRIQVFEGVVLKRQGSGARETFTVRKQSFGVGVERTFPVHSPKIEKLEIAARGDVRRAKLYYLRDRVGKAARVAERRWGITDEVLGDEDSGALDSEGEAQEELEPEEIVDSGAGEEADDSEDGAAEESDAAEAEDEGGEDSAPEASSEDDAGTEAEAEGDGDESDSQAG